MDQNNGRLQHRLNNSTPPELLPALFCAHLASPLEVRRAVDIPLPDVDPIKVLLLRRSAVGALSEVCSRDFYCIRRRRAPAAATPRRLVTGGVLSSAVVVRAPGNSIQEFCSRGYRGRQLELFCVLLSLLLGELLLLQVRRMDLLRALVQGSLSRLGDAIGQQGNQAGR